MTTGDIGEVKVDGKIVEVFLGASTKKDRRRDEEIRGGKTAMGGLTTM